MAPALAVALHVWAGMYRSIVVGLLGAVLYFLVGRQTIVVTSEPPPQAAPARTAPEPRAGLQVVDVASALPADTLYELVGLGRGETIRAIDDIVMADDAEARALLELRASDRGFLNVTVDHGGRERRVVLLVH